MGFVAEAQGGVFIEVKVKTRSSRPGIEWGEGGELVARLSSPPVDGRANDELYKLLAGILGLPKAAISIVRGEASRHKRVFAKGIDVTRARRLLTGKE